MCEAAADGLCKIDLLLSLPDLRKTGARRRRTPHFYIVSVSPGTASPVQKSRTAPTARRPAKKPSCHRARIFFRSRSVLEKPRVSSGAITRIRPSRSSWNSSSRHRL